MNSILSELPCRQNSPTLPYFAKMPHIFNLSDIDWKVIVVN